MKVLEKSKDKIQEICNTLRQETLQPAKKEAEKILEEAKREAQEIIEEARKDAQDLVAETKEQNHKDKLVFEASLKEAAKLSVETLKQEIEQRLFHQTLADLVETKTKEPKAIESLIAALVQAIHKEGLSADFSALIPRDVDPEAINALLKKSILKQLREEGVVVDHFKGGAKIKMHDKKITIDISDEAITALLETHLRKDFRKWLF